MFVLISGEFMEDFESDILVELALELYKDQNATFKDVLIGDMDENDLIDANDASLILEYFKTH